MKRLEAKGLPGRPKQISGAEIVKLTEAPLSLLIYIGVLSGETCA
jgi:hypothetical protein